MVRLPPLLLGIYAGLSLMLTFLHAYNVNMVQQFDQLREGRHMEIIEGRGKAPYGYRVLIPKMVEPVRRVLEGAGFQKMTAREAPYLGLRWIFTFIGLLLFHAFLSAWFDTPWTIAGTLLFAALHPATYYHYWYQPASCLDLTLWLLAARLAQTKTSPWWLVPVVIVGAFNRETIVFLPVIYLTLAYGSIPLKRLAIPVGVGLAVWAGIFSGLRWWIIGPLPRVVTISEILHENRTHPWWIIYAIVFLGILWILPVRGWQKIRPELQRLVLVLIPYLVLQFLFGRIREVRLLLPLAMVLIPIALDRLKQALMNAKQDPPGNDS